MSKKQDTFSGQIAAAVEGCGQTRYAIHKATGLSQSMLSKVVSGKGWTGRETMDVLAAYLGLVIVVKNPKTTASTTRKPKTAKGKVAPVRS